MSDINKNTTQKSQSLLEHVQASGLREHLSPQGWRELLNVINKLTPKEDNKNENEEIFRPLLDYFDKISLSRWINSDELIELSNILCVMDDKIIEKLDTIKKERI